MSSPTHGCGGGGQKTKTVFVKCVIVSSDGWPVDAKGEEIYGRQKPIYEWEKRRRSVKWLSNPKNKKYWREVSRRPRETK